MSRPSAAMIDAVRFLLAKLHCDALMMKTKPRDVLQALEKFREAGNALDRAYEETMERINSQADERKELAGRVLICITFCAQPLTVGEVQHAVAVDASSTDLKDYDLDNPNLMVSSCAGLVTVDAQSTTMRLVHYTTQIFLESLSEGFLLNPHGFLASCCLNYLDLDAFTDGHPYVDDSVFRFGRRLQEVREIRCLRELGEMRRLQYPFLEYSAAY